MKRFLTSLVSELRPKWMGGPKPFPSPNPDPQPEPDQPVPPIPQPVPPVRNVWDRGRPDIASHL